MKVSNIYQTRIVCYNSGRLIIIMLFGSLRGSADEGNQGKPGVSRRGLLLGGVAAAITAAVGAGVWETMDHEGPEVRPAPVDQLKDGTPVYEKAAHVLNYQALVDEENPSGCFERLVGVLAKAYGSHDNLVAYYEAGGVSTVTGAPADFKGTQEKVDWHNQNRQNFYHPKEGVVFAKVTRKDDKIDGETAGYPFEIRYLKKVDLDLVRERVNDKTHNANYLEDEPRSILEFISLMADKYKVPREFIVGIGATESRFNKNTPDSGVAARGLYQFLDTTAEKEAYPYLLSVEALGEVKGKKVRTKELKYEDYDPKNRFVQTELACAHYKFLEQAMQPALARLEARLKSLDSSFSVQELTPLCLMTAYNGGKDMTTQMIDRLLALSDKRLKTRIGEGPYGKDVWMAVLAYNFGNEFDVVEPDGTAKKLMVGKEVFHYPLKVSAWAKLLLEKK